VAFGFITVAIINKEGFITLFNAIKKYYQVTYINNLLLSKDKRSTTGKLKNCYQKKFVSAGNIKRL
jgi:hypothetical protein